MWEVKSDGLKYGVIREDGSGAVELHYPGYTIADEQTAKRLADELNEAEEQEEHEK